MALSKKLFEREESRFTLLGVHPIVRIEIKGGKERLLIALHAHRFSLRLVTGEIGS